jgi:acetyl esterase/lipase
MDTLTDGAAETRNAEAPDAAGIFRIWPGDGAPKGSEGWTQRETTMQVPWSTLPRRLTRNVVVPTITVFRPDPAKANGAGMIVAPGGAFHFLMIDYEGYDMARWLVARGITAFVLKYRVVRTPDDDAELNDFRTALQARLSHPGPTDTEPPPPGPNDEVRRLGEEDGRQAVRFIRAHAADWGVDPHRVGIIGFSAGGAVALAAATSAEAASRPDFAAAIYPAYRGGIPVPADAPPLFLAIADDDKSIAPISTARLYEAWHKLSRPVELHIFGNGAHGFGVGAAGLLSDPWMDLFGNWLRAQGLAGAAP